MAKKLPIDDLEKLPECAQDFIKLVTKKMRYRKKVRAEVMAELITHFEDELEGTAGEAKELKAQEIIEQFGDVKLLAVLMRRAKKRCRALWRTIVARTFQTIGVLIIFLVLYTAWFLTGKPAITVDYIRELNRVDNPVSDEALNAYAFYNKAAELRVKTPDDVISVRIKEYQKGYNELTKQEKDLIEKFIVDNNEAIELVVEGSKNLYYWRHYYTRDTYDTKGDNDMMSIIWPNLAMFRELATDLRWRARFSAEKGLYEDAFNDIKVIYRFGQHLRGDKILVEQYVGIALEGLAIHALEEVLSGYQIDSASLVRLQKDFEQITADENFDASYEAEKLVVYDTIQRCFTEDKTGGGHLYLKEFSRLETGFSRLRPRDYTYFKLLPRIPQILFTHPNKKQTIEMANRYFTFWSRQAYKTPAQMRAKNIDYINQSRKIISNNLLLQSVVPALGRANAIGHSLKADARAVITIIALLRYKKDKGFYPEILEQLVSASYLKQLPIDPYNADEYSSKALTYKRVGDDFILYSFGKNFEDDGGEVAKEARRYRNWGTKTSGDRVFWPVQKM